MKIPPEFRRSLLFGIALGVAFGISLACSCCAPAPNLEEKATLGDDANILIVAEGDVSIKRKTSDHEIPASFGTILHQGDQVIVPGEARAAVLCDGLSLWVPPSGLRSGIANGCPAGAAPGLERSEGNIALPRSGSDPTLPYILHPRSTYILDPQPVLAWNAVPGAAHYTVSVQGEGLTWSERVTGTRVQYTGRPAFRAGVTYVVCVEAENGRSSEEEGAPGLGFTLLDRTAADRAGAGAQQIRELGLSGEAASYALAVFYRGQGLNSEAALLLEQATQQGSQSHSVYLLLGDLYSRMGLHREAQPAFARALDLAQQRGDVETQAFALAGLGRAYTATGASTDATAHLTQAAELFRSLGDVERADAIDQDLAGLQP